jgi:arabinose-5-phosphate isomerase
MSEVIIKMTEKRFGCVGVVEDDQLIGVITDGDLRRHMGAQLFNRAAGDVMTVNPRTIRSRALAAEAVAVMNEVSITSLFVVENGEPIGILHIHDCLRAGVR